MKREDALESMRAAAAAARRIDSPMSLRWAAVLDTAIADVRTRQIQEEFLQGRNIPPEDGC